MAKQKKRNGHAFHPIMKKGGVHEKSKSAKRKAEKLELKKQIKEWHSRSFFVLNSTYSSFSLVLAVIRKKACTQVIKGCLQ